MADVAELIVRAGWEGADLTRGLAKSASEVQDFGRHIVSLQGQFSKFAVPAPMKDTSAQISTAITTLKALGVALKEVERDASGSRVFATVAKDVDTANAIFQKLGASARIVATEFAATAQELAKSDAALRNRIALLAEGTRMNATQSASAKELRGIYAQLSREIATGNPPLERKIALERELVRIRKEFATISAASRPVTIGTEFANAAIPARNAANALDQVRAKTDGARRSFTLINQATGEFTAAGRKASGAAIGIAFGLEALARGGTAADGGLRTALRSVASFAAFFGPKGLIVSGVAAATAAIIDLFTKSREEMEKTQQSFQDSLVEMVRGADVVGIQKEMQKLQVGEIKLNESTGIFELTDGLIELTKQLREAKAARDVVFQQNVARGAFSEEAKRVKELEEQIRPLQAQYDLLKRTLENFPTLPRPPQLAQSVSTAGKKDVDLATEAFKHLKDQIDETTRAATLLVGKHVEQRDLGLKMLELYDQAQALLGRQGDKTGKTANDLREMVKQLEAFGEVQSLLLRRAFPIVPGIKVDPAQNKSTF